MNDHVRNEDLAAYVDGRLDTAGKSELEKHFAGCPQCLDELVDLAVIMGGRDRVPARFLEQALGDKNASAPAPLRLRLVFEVAAAVMVVVFIGYFFLSNNRFWQGPAKQTPSDMMRESKSLPAYGATDSFEEPAPPAVLPGKLTESDPMADDAQDRKKESRTTVSKDIPPAAGQAMPAGQDKGALPQSAPAMPQPAAEVEGLLKPELQRVELKSKALDSSRLDAAARSRPTAQTMDLNAARNQQGRQQETQVAVAAQTASPAKKQNEALSRNALSEKLAAYPVRIEGDVSWSNLQNPEQIISWSWFPKELVLELQIDGAGTVTAIVPSGKVEERLVAQAASEAQKLVFAISEKKSRRARLVAKDAPPDPAMEDSSLK